MDFCKVVMARRIEPLSDGNVRSVSRRRLCLLAGTALAACLLGVSLTGMVIPRYTAQARLLLEDSNDQPFVSRDMARRAAADLGLHLDDIDPGRLDPFWRILERFAMRSEPAEAASDARLVTAFLDRLVVEVSPAPRFASISFTSRDPRLAARAANEVASLILEEMVAVKRRSAREAISTLAGQIAALRERLSDVDRTLAPFGGRRGQASDPDGSRLRDLKRSAETLEAQLASETATYESLARNMLDSGPANPRLLQRATVPDESARPKFLAFAAAGLIVALMMTSVVLAWRRRLGTRLQPAGVGDRPMGAEPGNTTVWHRTVAARPHPIGDRGIAGWSELATRGVAPSRRADGPGRRVERSETLVQRIVEAHVPGHGLHIVCAGIAGEGADILLDLARMLSEKGRTIIVDLDKSSAKLAPLARADEAAEAEIAGLSGLSDLLVGGAAFADVMHRDHASRLHFIPAGRLRSDFCDFDLILDALSATYDFVVLVAPACPRSEVATIMAPYADFVVLAAGADLEGKTLDETERVLVTAGARDVSLLAGSRSEAELELA